jgi:hypothetical protein
MSERWRPLASLTAGHTAKPVRFVAAAFLTTACIKLLPRPYKGVPVFPWEAPHWLEERPAAILPGYYRGARGTGAFPLASVLAG